MSFLRVNGVTQVEEPIARAEPAAKPVPKQAAKPSPNSEVGGPFLAPESLQDLRKRWDGIQTSFVDEPRDAVRQADEVVASAIKRLTESFTEARTNLGDQWTGGDEVNTEDLRVALKEYRSLFQKLISV